MKKSSLLLLLLSLIALLTACGNSDEFVIECQIHGLGERGVELVYIDNGTVVHKMFHPVDGKIKLRGSSADYTLAAVCPLDYGPLLECVVRNGDRLRVSMDINRPESLVVEGNKPSEEYTKFITANDSILTRGSTEQINALIGRYVAANPSSLASTMLMICRFRPYGHDMQTDSLLRLLTPEARTPNLTASLAAQVSERVSIPANNDVRILYLRPALINRKDTVERFSPTEHTMSLLAFNSTYKPDSTLRTLKALHADYTRKRLGMTEISFTPDSAIWRTQIQRDTVKWAQSWIPGGPAAQQMRSLNVPSTPYYILTDSLGTPIYRGPSLATADRLIRSKMPAGK